MMDKISGETSWKIIRFFNILIIFSSSALDNDRSLNIKGRSSTVFIIVLSIVFTDSFFLGFIFALLILILFGLLLDN